MRARTTSTPSSWAGRKPVSRPSAAPEAAPVDVTIQRVGHLGDGLGAAADGRNLCVPATLPGERVSAQPIGQRGSLTLARIVAMLTPSPDRVPAPCPHFDACGGCALQHWATAPYLEWKEELLRAALQGAGYDDPPILPIVDATAAGRRRIDLAFRRNGHTATLGLHEASGSAIVDMHHCVVVHPRLQDLLAPLRTLLPDLSSAGVTGRIAVSLFDSGPDVLVRGEAMPSTAERLLITEFSRARGISRWHWASGTTRPEAICILQTARLRFADVDVEVPADAFLQATQSGEAAIVAAVMAGLSALKATRPRLAELYAGCGTLSFALASFGTVAAFEGNRQALVALQKAANHALPGRIECCHRDLVRRPLTPRELSGFTALVLDPPWSGAAVQIAQIGLSTVERVIYVSCNPAALRRDAETLRRAGFDIVAATPIDQFRWSAQLESVIVFTR